jgi:plasmid stability protein
MCSMTALHVRNVPESVVTALRERAARHGQSMQQEIRQILEAAAQASPPREPPEPVRLTTVRTAVTSTWDREQIYGDAGR